MSTDVIRRFRDGVAAKRFTLTQLKALTDIPIATLSDMRNEEWRPEVFDRLEKLERALDKIDAERARAEAKAKRRKEAAA